MFVDSPCEILIFTFKRSSSGKNELSGRFQKLLKMKRRSCPSEAPKEGSSVSSKTNQRTSAGVQLKTYPSSKTKKPRLQQFAFRTCLICTVEVQEPELPNLNLESLDQQNEALDQLSTLLGLGSCRLNIRNPINYTICGTCRGRLDQLTSMIDNIKILETEVNLLTEALYSDLQKSFRNVDADESRSEVIQYRNHLVENQKTFVFEAKPLKNNLIERVSSWHEDENLNHSGDSGTSVQGFGDELMETELDFDEIDFQVENAEAVGKQESIIDDTGATNDMIETTVHKELQVFSCDYVEPGGRSKCQMSFDNEEALEIHTNVHTLHVSLENSKRIVEQHGIKIFKEMLKLENTMKTNQSMACPACGREPFQRFSELIQHMFTVHRFQTYPCLYYANHHVKCSGLFGSEEDVQEHVKSCHEVNDEMMCVICGASNCCHEVRRSAAIEESLQNSDQNVAAYPQRVENDEMMCVICGPKTKTCRTKTAHIKHMLSSHSYFVCNYKDSNGLANCLGGFNSEVAVKYHLKVEHQVEALKVEDLELQYLDPRYQSFQCPNCGRKYLFGQAYVNHLREHGLFVCGAKKPNTIKSFCTSAFDCETELDLHANVCIFRKKERQNHPIVNSFGPNSTWCRICKFHLKFSSRATWLDHVKKHGAFACNIYIPDKKRFCNELYMVRPLLKSHIDTDHPNVEAGEAVGPIDNGGSTGIDVLNEQPLESIRGLPVEGSFACSNCDATFEVYDQTWVDHVMSHGAMICDAIGKGSEKPCLALFYRLETLRMHCKKQHERILEGGLHCKVCGRNFESLKIPNGHQSHGSERGLICDGCGAEGKAAESSQLKAHGRAWHNRKNKTKEVKPRSPNHCSIETSRCEVCGKWFSNSKKLATHAVTHAAEDNVEKDKDAASNLDEAAEYKCLICEYKVSKSFQSMYRHMIAMHNLELFRKFGDSDVFCSCFACLVTFEPSDTMELSGRMLLEDKEKFLTFAAEHAVCNRKPVSEFTCPKCQAQFTEPKLLFKHVLKSHSEKRVRKHTCKQCESEFDNNVEYLHHLRQKHGEQVKMKCQCYRCGKQFQDMATLQAHVLESSKQLQCPACDQNFKGLESYQKHKCSHGQAPAPEEVRSTQVPAHCFQLNGGFPCLPCNKTFDSVALLSIHFQEYHDKAEEINFNCSICSTTLTGSETLRKNGEETFYSTNDDFEHTNFTSLCTQHWKSCTANQDGTPCSEIREPLFKCYVCLKNQDSPQSLAVHLNEHHGVSEVYRCRACNLVFSTKRLLDVHVASTHNLKSCYPDQYHCRSCWEPFLSTDPEMKLGAVAEQDMLQFHSFLDRHFQCKAARIKRKCRHCPYESANVYKLFGHDVRFYSKKHYQHYCERCGKGYAEVTSLNIHFQTHEVVDGKRERLACEICGKTYDVVQRLKDHMESHNDHRPFICQYCGNGFTVKAHLVRHEKKHFAVKILKEATVPCPICGKLFKSPGYMQLHVRHVHEKLYEWRTSALKLKEATVPCPICGKLFKTPGYMRVHFRYVHENLHQKRNSPKKPTLPEDPVDAWPLS